MKKRKAREWWMIANFNLGGSVTLFHKRQPAALFKSEQEARGTSLLDCEGWKLIHIREVVPTKKKRGRV